MSHPHSIDLTALRHRLQAVIEPDCELDGSLYLHTLACAYLACDAEEDAGEEAELETLFTGQAELEDVDSDDLLTRLILIGGRHAQP